MCILDLGWEQSGGESAPAVAGVAYRLWARRIAGAWPGRTAESVSWGGCEGRDKAGAYGVLMRLMGLAGRGLAGHFRLGTCYEKRHPVDEAVGGALRGRSPRTREGRLGPTAQTAVVSSKRRRFFRWRPERELTVAWSTSEVCDCSHQFGDAFATRYCRSGRGRRPFGVPA